MRDAFAEIERARSALWILDAGTDRDTWVKNAMAAKAAGLDRRRHLARVAPSTPPGCPTTPRAGTRRAVWQILDQRASRRCSARVPCFSRRRGRRVRMLANGESFTWQRRPGRPAVAPGKKSHAGAPRPKNRAASGSRPRGAMWRPHAWAAEQSNMGRGRPDPRSRLPARQSDTGEGLRQNADGRTPGAGVRRERESAELPVHRG